MKSNKALVYVPLQKPTHLDLDNLSHIMFTLNNPWDLFYINDVSEGNII